MKKSMLCLSLLLLSGCALFDTGPKEGPEYERGRLQNVLKNRCLAIGEKRDTKEYFNCRVYLDAMLKRREIDVNNPTSEDINKIQERFRQQDDTCIRYGAKRDSVGFESCLKAHFEKDMNEKCEIKTNLTGSKEITCE